MNILWYKPMTSDNTLVAVVRSKIKALDEQAQRQGLSQLYYAPDGGKRKLDEGPTSAAKKPRLDEGSTASAVLEFVNRPVCFASTDPNVLLSAPGLPQHSDMVALARGQSISDMVVDPYLALLCHKGNGHFDGDDGFQREGSPKWFAWSTSTAVGIISNQDTDKTVFPPQTYPAGKLVDVWHHVFPVRYGRDDWAMFILTRIPGGEKELAVFSSMADRQSSALIKSWPLIGKWLEGRDRDLNGVSGWKPTWPTQPDQGTELDGGVFLCCILRWLIEGWPLEELRQDDIGMLRRRMVRELESWTLSV